MLSMCFLITENANPMLAILICSELFLNTNSKDDENIPYEGNEHQAGWKNDYLFHHLISTKTSVE